MFTHERDPAGGILGACEICDRQNSFFFLLFSLTWNSSNGILPVRCVPECQPITAQLHLPRKHARARAREVRTCTCSKLVWPLIRLSPDFGRSTCVRPTAQSECHSKQHSNEISREANIRLPFEWLLKWKAFGVACYLEKVKSPTSTDGIFQ